MLQGRADRGAAAVHNSADRRRRLGHTSAERCEEPAEDATTLLAEVADVLARLKTLSRRINRTNTAAEVTPGTSLTDALARRDVLRLRHSVLAGAADAAAGRGDHSYVRQLRSELKMLSALPVAELRRQADELAREIRETDVAIQRANWEVDLIE